MSRSGPAVVDSHFGQLGAISGHHVSLCIRTKIIGHFHFSASARHVQTGLIISDARTRHRAAFLCVSCTQLAHFRVAESSFVWIILFVRFYQFLQKWRFWIIRRPIELTSTKGPASEPFRAVPQRPHRQVNVGPGMSVYGGRFNYLTFVGLVTVLPQSWSGH